MKTIKEFENHLYAGGLSEGTIQLYLSRARSFARRAGKEWGQEEIEAFLAKLRKKGVKESTRRNYLYALKRLCAFNEVPFVLRAVSEDEQETERRIMSVEEIETLIRNVKNSDDPGKVYLALSTIYGLRREEIASVRQEDIHEDMIYIRTRKKGKARHHLIPEAISFVRGFDYPSISTSNLSILFKAILLRAGLGMKLGYGWHSIRRRLVTEFVSGGLHPSKIRDFMRWRSGSRDILEVYTQLDPRTVDQEVFDIHPFLPMWEEP